MGSDFFNATIVFNSNSDKFYQQTPGVSFGRAGFKQPGFRNVQRFKLNENNITENKIKLNVFQERGESRIYPESLLHLNLRDKPITTELESEEDLIPNIIKLNDINYSNILSVWNSSELLSEENDNKYVIVWQWCSCNNMNNSNVWQISENWWKSYDNQATKYIETAYHSFNSSRINLPNNYVTIDTIAGIKYIYFQPNSFYAKQTDSTNTKVRTVRRVLKTVKELKEMFQNVRPNSFVNIEQILETLEPGEIPYQFICPISQTIMKNPVKTDDGHVYDKDFIERWFNYNNTSPLTGLSLSNLDLTPFDSLLVEINKFLERFTTSSDSTSSSSSSSHSTSSSSSSSSSTHLTINE